MVREDTMQKELLTIATILSMALAVLFLIIGFSTGDYRALITAREIWWIAFAFAVLNVVAAFSDNWQYKLLKWRTKRRLTAYPLWVSNGRAYEREVKQAFLVNAERLGVDQGTAERDFNKICKSRTGTNRKA